MKYVLSGKADWADEFDVHFFEVLDERDKTIYDIANKIFGSWIGYHGFGTNEYFDDFEFLGSKTIICRQIGNAVPPKMAFFLANVVKHLIQ